MSALPPKADMLSVGIDVCYVPEADIGDMSSSCRYVFGKPDCTRSRA